MKVGVVIPVFNTLEYIENCLRSINNQTYLKKKVYLVDDASTQRTKEGFTLFEFLSHRKESLTKGYALARNERNLGWPVTLNRAAKMAVNDGCSHLFIMNSDDWLRIDAIEKMMDLLKKSGSDWVNCYGQQIGGENVVMVSKKNAQLSDFKEHTVLTNWALIKSDVWEQLGGYSEDLYINTDIKAGYEDWEFWIRAIKAGYKYSVSEEVLYFYRMHEKQLHKKTVAFHEIAKAKIFEKHTF